MDPHFTTAAEPQLTMCTPGGQPLRGDPVPMRRWGIRAHRGSRHPGSVSPTAIFAAGRCPESRGGRRGAARPEFHRRPSPESGRGIIASGIEPPARRRRTAHGGNSPRRITRRSAIGVPGGARGGDGHIARSPAGGRSCRPIPPDADLAGTRPHRRRVAPCPRPREKVHADAESLPGLRRRPGRQRRLAVHEVRKRGPACAGKPGAPATRDPNPPIASVRTKAPGREGAVPIPMPPAPVGGLSTSHT